MNDVPTAEPIHELLPWYVAGTLAATEADAFRKHLPACPACREEMAVLESLRAEVERHGADFLREHPSAERLVAAVRGELDAAETATVRRHLALCSTCAAESRWVAGEAHAEGKPVDRASGPAATGAALRPWIWALAAAAAVFVAMLPLSLRGPSAPGLPLGIPSSIFIAAPERDGRPPAYVVPDDGPVVNLTFEIDLAAAGTRGEPAFPATFRLLDAGGRLVMERHDIGKQHLAGGVHLNVPCPRSACPDGDYVGLIEPAPGSATTAIRFPFRLQSD